MASPHVVILPLPAQGHVKPMLMLAELLSEAGLTISFVNSEHNHQRLVNLTDHAAYCRRFPGIKFLSIPDGLPPDHPRSGLSVINMFFTTSTVGKPVFRDMIGSMSQKPTCIISDGMMSFAIDVAEEFGIPAITFRTYSATCTWITFFFPELLQEGDLPIREEGEDMDRPVSRVPGLENIIRRRDLPSITKLKHLSIEIRSKVFQFYISQALKMKKASALILNTFEELEAPMISRLHSIYPAVYSIGPLHTAVKSSVAYSTTHDSSSLMQSDQSCMEWLDSHHPKSVLYVSFGSVVVLTRDQLLEFWYGLVNSGKPFLWAIRPDLIWGDDGMNRVPDELKAGTEQRGRIVSWAPQEDVLAHVAVGGFLTHSGWNSTLESIAAGKPMICWPRVADQQVNGRCVSEMWKLGLDLNVDICDRAIVEKTVRDLMEGKNEEITKSANEVAALAQASIRDGGSSHRNMKKLIEDIRLMHAASSTSASKSNN